MLYCITLTVSTENTIKGSSIWKVHFDGPGDTLDLSQLPELSTPIPVFPGDDLVGTRSRYTKTLRLTMRRRSTQGSFSRSTKCPAL